MSLSVETILSDIYHQSHLNKVDIKKLAEGNFEAIKPLMESLEKSRKSLSQISDKKSQ